MMFFEGPEKKVELVVAPGFRSLRGLGEAFWQNIVAKANAKILSAIKNDYCDAYLLSESSLFVYDDHIIMFTCGRTTLVQSVIELLKSIPADQIASLIYERKNEHFPHLQPSSFFSDARVLHERIPGRAFRFGSQDDHHICLYHIDRAYIPEPNDVTIEILMHDISPRARDIFCAGSRHTVDYIRNKTGIREIYSGFKVEDHVFQPEGYSLNAIRDREYYTIHVTPQEAGSYVSFETNRDLNDDAINETLDHLLTIFSPRSFDLVRFQSDQRPSILGAMGYQIQDEVAQNLSCGYLVSFQHYFLPQAEKTAAYEFRLDAAARENARGAAPSEHAPAVKRRKAVSREI